MSLKSFDEFLSHGIIKKQSVNKQRAKSLVKEAYDKKQFLTIALNKIPTKDMNSNFVIDSSYDIIMELIRAKMFLDGFNSSNSHEAEVSYLHKLDFSEYDVRFLDELRYNRNGIKYYGALFDKEYANKVLEFMEKIYPRLKSIIDKNA